MPAERDCLTCRWCSGTPPDTCVLLADVFRDRPAPAVLILLHQPIWLRLEGRACKAWESRKQENPGACPPASASNAGVVSLCCARH